MRNTKHELEQATRNYAFFFYGTITDKLETFASSCGIPTPALAGQLGELLLRAASGQVLGPADSMPAMLDSVSAVTAPRTLALASGPHKHPHTRTPLDRAYLRRPEKEEKGTRAVTPRRLNMNRPMGVWARQLANGEAPIHPDSTIKAFSLLHTARELCELAMGAEHQFTPGMMARYLRAAGIPSTQVLRRRHSKGGEDVIIWCLDLTVSKPQLDLLAARWRAERQAA